MLKIFQISIIAAVIASNIHWEWTPNPYLPSIYGVMAAVGATWILWRLADLRAEWRRRRVGKQQRVHEAEALRRHGGTGRSLLLPKR